MKYILLINRPSSSDRYGDYFPYISDCFKFEKEEEFIDKIAEFRVLNKHLEHAECEYEITAIKGSVVFSEYNGFGCVDDEDANFDFKVENQTKILIEKREQEIENEKIRKEKEEIAENKKRKKAKERRDRSTYRRLKKKYE